MPGTRIAGFTATPVSIPFEEPVWWTGGHHPGTSKAIIALEMDQGLVGLGKARSVDVMPRIEAMGARLIGSDALDIAGCDTLCVPPWRVVQNTDDSSFPKAFGFIEIALWDLREKADGEPLYRLPGGAVRKDIPFTHHFVCEGAEMPSEAMAAHCFDMHEEHGSTLFEGELILGAPEREIETVKAMCAAPTRFGRPPMH